MFFRVSDTGCFQNLSRWVVCFCTVFFSAANSNAFNSFSEFQTKLNKEKVSDIPGAISILPESYLKNYTLIHSSKSLQSSSFLYPRAILFGSTGNLIYTFNGDPADSGYYALETAEKGKDNILFREVVFFKDAKFSPANSSRKEIAARFSLKESEIEYLDKQKLISKPNPAKCLACHLRSAKDFGTTNYTRYIWNSYNEWPDAYGANDDSLVSATIKADEEIDLGPSIKDLNNTIIYDIEKRSALKDLHLEEDLSIDSLLEKGSFHSLEKDDSNLAKFLDYKVISTTHPRYKQLYNPFLSYPYYSGSVIFYYFNGASEGRFSGRAMGTYFYSDVFLPKIPRLLAFMPNTRLSSLIGENMLEVSLERYFSSHSPEEKDLSQLCQHDALNDIEFTAGSYSLNFNREDKTVFTTGFTVLKSYFFQRLTIAIYNKLYPSQSISMDSGKARGIYNSGSFYQSGDATYEDRIKYQNHDMEFGFGVLKEICDKIQ